MHIQIMHALYVGVTGYAGRTSLEEPHGRPRALLATRGARRDAHGLHRVASQRAVHCMACPQHAMRLCERPPPQRGRSAEHGRSVPVRTSTPNEHPECAPREYYP